jgi:aminopeptidase YwaD
MKAKIGVAIVLFAALSLAGCLTVDSGKDALRANLRSLVTFLASDSLEGRLVGTPGIDKAGRYIAHEFEKIGLAPAFDGSYFQEFELQIGMELGTTPVLRMGDMELAYMEDFSVLPFSGSGALKGRGGRWPIEAVPGGPAVVFAFADLEREKERWTMTGRDALLDWMRDAGVEASKCGAGAVVFVSGRPEHPDASLHTFALSRTYAPLDIPALEVTYGALERAMASRGITPDRIAVIPMHDIGFLDMEPSVDCTVEVAAGPASIKVSNVGGLLRGRGTGYIVIGAHYDHLGYGDIASSTPWRREIHPGADDNASGDAAVMEIARILSSYGQPERSVIFLAFTAEELGALGSEYYCKHAPYPIDSTVAMINLDTVGRLEDGKLIAFGARSAEEFSRLLAEAGKGHSLEIIEKEEIYGFSDQNPFYARGVPALHFFTGAHDDYHSPDDVWQNINFEGLASLTSFVADFAGLLAFHPTPLTPVAAEPEEAPTAARGSGAHLGIVPDFTYAGTGVGIKGTVPESPAEQAGLRGGDVIVGIDDTPINDLKGLMTFLISKSPGDSIEIRVMRGPHVEPLKAVLSARSSHEHGD